MTSVFLGLGSNLGSRFEQIEYAIESIGKYPSICIELVSSFYETKPFGYVDQPDFINAAIKIRTDLSPKELLTVVKDLERKMLRQETFKWGPRIIDIDILLFGDLIIDEPDLTIPHPLMHVREFVLKPLLEIGASVIHPKLGSSIQELYQNLDY